MEKINRKQFLKATAAGLAGGLVVPTYSWAQNDKGKALDKALVKEFVLQAHRDDDKVKAMLEETPDLLNAVHNIGTWDWEDAVGASGHMGRRDLTLFLLENGARMTICVAAMLGELQVVKSMIEAFPYMKEAKGPHNISMLKHAIHGKEYGEPVVEYLNSIGITK